MRKNPEIECESTRSHMEDLIERFRGLIERMPYHGDKCEDSQRQCLLQVLFDLEKNVNGLRPRDFTDKQTEQ